MLLSIKKDIFIEAPTVLVARIVTITSIGKGDSGYTATSAKLAPVKILRGPDRLPLTGKLEFHWCADYNPTVTAGKVYLLAMSGADIHAAIPLELGKERTDVAVFYKQIAEPDPWR